MPWLPMSSSMLSPAMTFIAEDFHISSPIIKSMVVSIQILAWAFGPLIIAPYLNMIILVVNWFLTCHVDVIIFQS